MSKILTQIKYTQAVRDIKAILNRDRDGSKPPGKRQVLQTNWQVGRYLAEACPGAGNARLIRHLAREFSQPMVYFQTVIKFYKRFPRITAIDYSVTWGEYKALLTAG